MKIRPWWPLLALALLVYWSGLSGPFVFDDMDNLKPVNQWLAGDKGWLSAMLAGARGSIGRPISMGSFLLNVALLGPNVWGMKLVNLLLHLLNATLVYALFRAFAARDGLVAPPTNTELRRWLPLLAAAIWLLHPLLVSTVLYVVQRMAMLSALFTLVAMLAYIHGRIALEQGRRRQAMWWLAAVPLATLLGTLSKENGILAPSLCALIELMLFAPAADAHRSRWSKAVVGFGLVLPAIVATGLIATRNPLLTSGYANRPFTLNERLLTQPRVLWDYIASILLPVGPKLGLYHDDYPISHGLLDPPATLVAILGWVLLIGVAWRGRRTVPGLALGIGIFLIGQSLESSALPLLMYFEHRNYLPAIGVIWASVSVLARLGQYAALHMHRGGQVFRAAGVGLVMVLALATAARASVWQTERGLMIQGLAYHPDSRWVRMDAARWAMSQKPPLADEARTQMEHMASSADPMTRRIAGVMRLVIDCMSATPVRDADVTRAFAGSVTYMEADALLAYERLADLVAGNQCRGLSLLQAADDLSGLVDRSPRAADEYNARRLRFKAAQLYARAQRLPDALEQARLAYRAGDHEGPIPAFAAQLAIATKDYALATRMLAAADAATRKDDIFGRQMVAGIRAQLADVQRSSTR